MYERHRLVPCKIAASRRRKYSGKSDLTRQRASAGNVPSLFFNHPKRRRLPLQGRTVQQRRTTCPSWRRPIKCAARKSYCSKNSCQRLTIRTIEEAIATSPAYLATSEKIMTCSTIHAYNPKKLGPLSYDGVTAAGAARRSGGVSKPRHRPEAQARTYCSLEA